MCNFVSWKDVNGKLYYLTGADKTTKEGRSLIKEKYFGNEYHEDIKGHGAVSIYWGIPYNTGKNMECTNFSSPDNFPKEIVEAIKRGAFCGIGYHLDLLNDKGKAEYKKIKQPALAEYKKIQQLALAEYKKIKQDAFWDIFAQEKYRMDKWK